MENVLFGLTRDLYLLLGSMDIYINVIFIYMLLQRRPTENQCEILNNRCGIDAIWDILFGIVAEEVEAGHGDDGNDNVE